jgi:hypothetical protein
MNTARDWMLWSVRLDAQPSNRRLVQQSRTPRMLREANLSPFDEQRANHIDNLMAITSIAFVAVFAVGAFFI